MEILDGTKLGTTGSSSCCRIEFKTVQQKETQYAYFESESGPHEDTSPNDADVPPGCKAVPAQNAENPEVAQLLLDCRDHATQLSRDADELESLTRSNASWQSHAVELEEMKDDVNAMGRLVPKRLNLVIRLLHGSSERLTASCPS